MESSAVTPLQGVCGVRRGAKVVYYRGEKRGIERTARRLFRRRLKACEYAALAGAPDDGEVEVGTLNAGLYLEMHEPATNAYHAVHLVRRVDAGLAVVIDAFYVCQTMRRMGLGLTIFARQLAAAAALGVVRIETTAGRSSDENGYYTWPRFGFDGPLPPEIKQDLPLGLDHAQDVLDLMECEKGRMWWQEHGLPIHLAFDLTPHSRSRVALDYYLGAKLRPSFDPTLGPVVRAVA